MRTGSEPAGRCPSPLVAARQSSRFPVVTLSFSHLQARLEICALRDTVAVHLTPESR